jgi:hypothetical protein
MLLRRGEQPDSICRHIRGQKSVEVAGFQSLGVIFFAFIYNQLVSRSVADVRGRVNTPSARPGAVEMRMPAVVLVCEL